MRFRNAVIAIQRELTSFSRFWFGDYMRACNFSGKAIKQDFCDLKA